MLGSSVRSLDLASNACQAWFDVIWKKNTMMLSSLRSGKDDIDTKKEEEGTLKNKERRKKTKWRKYWSFQRRGKRWNEQRTEMKRNEVWCVCERSKPELWETVEVRVTLFCERNRHTDDGWDNWVIGVCCLTTRCFRKKKWLFRPDIPTFVWNARLSPCWNVRSYFFETPSISLYLSFSFNLCNLYSLERFTQYEWSHCNFSQFFEQYGNAAVAARDFAAGEVVLNESPLLVDRGGPIESCVSAILKAYAMASSACQQEVLSLFHPEDKAENSKFY